MKECCQKPENREARDRDPVSGAALAPGVELYVCAECGCRHFEATVDPAELGMRFTAI